MTESFKVAVPPPLLAVTGFPVKVALTPLGRPDRLSVTVKSEPLSPFVAVTETELLEPRVTLTEETPVATVNGAVTVIAALALWVSEPPVPVTVCV